MPFIHKTSHPFIITCLYTMGIFVSSCTIAQHYYADVQTSLGLNQIKEDSIVSHPGPNPYHVPKTRLDTNGGATAFVDLGIRSGIVKTINNKLSYQLGLGIYASLPQTLTGKTQTAVGNPWDASYQYKIHTYRAMFEGRLYLQALHKLSLFLGASFGWGHIDTSALSYTKIDPNFVPPQTAAVHQNHLVYSAVIGGAYHFNAKWGVEADLNKSWLGHNKIYVNMGDKTGFNINQGSLNPWLISLALSYAF